MYTIVIADDEIELRGAIIRNIDWEGIGFRVVGEAENGIEALELVEKMEPDLLLTDIRMPYLSGIELAREIREVRPATQIAFLSGFDDFTYAQQAIQYNIISYMLKPITMAELTEELVKIREKIDSLFREFDSKQKEWSGISEFVIPLLVDKFRKEAGEQEERLLEKAVSCGLLQNGQNRFRYVVMTTSVRTEKGGNCTHPAHVHSVDIILRKYMKYFSFYSQGRVVSLLIATAASFEKYLHIIVEEITQSVERILQLKVAVGVSRMVERLSSCHEAYADAVHALNYARGGDGVHYIADEERVGSLDMEGVLNHITEIEKLIRSGSEEELQAYLREMFKALEAEKASRVKVNFLLIQLLTAVYRIIYAVAGSEDRQKAQDYELLQKMSFFDGMISEERDKFIDFCMGAREMISAQRKKSSEVMCDRTLHIIETQYQNPELSLVSASNEVNVSPNYLSALIKKDTGKTFVDLLTRKRIEKARELLLCTSMKIREITEKCGYRDQHYFSYCFKKYYGISPNALRQQINQEETV